MNPTTTPAASHPGTEPGSVPGNPADRTLADRCQTSGDYLAGLLAAGHLEAASAVTKLPTALFPDWPADMVQAVWDAALPVGFQAGKLSVRPTWTRDALDRLRDAMDKAGYEAMGRLVARSATLHPPRHPADDDESARHHDDEPGVVVRDGDWW